MINLHQVEEAIRELEAGSTTYNNCMKLASLYIIRDELSQGGSSSRGMYTYGKYPMMYERGGRSGNSGRSGSSNYGYYGGYERPLMYHDDQDLMIGQDMYRR